jgi:hypothetical protein
MHAGAPAISSPRHEPTSRHGTPDAPRRHTPDRHEPTKPKGPDRPKDHKPTGSGRKSTSKRSGRHKSAPRGADQLHVVGVLDLSHTPTLGTLPN